jgi:hypothetical protein
MSGGSNRSLWPTKLLPLRCSRADVPGPEPEDEGGARPNRLTSSIRPGEKDEEKATLARREQRQLSSGRELICTFDFAFSLNLIDDFHGLSFHTK